MHHLQVVVRESTGDKEFARTASPNIAFWEVKGGQESPAGILELLSLISCIPEVLLEPLPGLLTLLVCCLSVVTANALSGVRASPQNTMSLFTRSLTASPPFGK
jgi:hypothetical protein